MGAVIVRSGSCDSESCEVGVVIVRGGRSLVSGNGVQ